MEKIDMDQVFIKAPAKINLTLSIVSKREDGYHNINSVMQTISLFDDVKIKKTVLPGVKLFTNLPYLPHDDKNLVYKMAKDLIEEYKIDYGVTINLYKRIPVGAGLAGGSTDCAATLKGMRKLFNLPISTHQAYQICERYGADVPFCYMGGTALAKGIGNILHRLDDHPQTFVVLVKPAFSISTEKIYKMLDMEEVKKVGSGKVINAIKTQNIKAIAANFYNALEAPAAFLHPQILKIKEALLRNGALGAIMSGSGSAVFGYFGSYYSAKKAARNLNMNFKTDLIFVGKTLINKRNCIEHEHVEK